MTGERPSSDIDSMPGPLSEALYSSDFVMQAIEGCRSCGGGSAYGRWAPSTLTHSFWPGPRAVSRTKWPRRRWGNWEWRRRCSILRPGDMWTRRLC